jgi:hypothetical protein
MIQFIVVSSSFLQDYISFILFLDFFFVVFSFVIVVLEIVDLQIIAGILHLISIISLLEVSRFLSPAVILGLWVFSAAGNKRFIGQLLGWFKGRDISSLAITLRNFHSLLDISLLKPKDL